MATIGIIGGSGLYNLPGLEDPREVTVDTPFGAPSDALVVGRLHDHQLVFLPRHGRGHRLLPSEINFRANIHALKQLGAEWVLSVTAVGSLREEIHPGDLVVVDQFIDRTRLRSSTFFGDGAAGHVQFARPICPVLSAALYESCGKLGAPRHHGGTYVCIEGPQFSTRAESELMRRDGAHVVGMTAMPEAKLAREAELCFASLALATDYDCWRDGHAEVSVSDVVLVMNKNVALARAVIAETASRIGGKRQCQCANAAEHALMTDQASLSEKTRARLGLIIGKYLKAK